MKYPLFEALGEEYPSALEQRYDRILQKIAALWDKPAIDEYFTSLIIDTRGGRRGFEPDVLNDILRLREFHESERLREVEDRIEAVRELERRGIQFRDASFLIAIHNGDQALVDLFVRAGINIHVQDDQGTPALIIALKKGYTVVARILLTAGADANARDAVGFTPLLLACGKTTQGYKEIAEKLIRQGADVNARDRLGWTPLLLALSGGTVEVIELLLERGANLFARTRKGDSALSLAQKSGNEDLVNLLFQKGAHF